MIEKRPIHPRRIRRIPGRFSWVDQRLVSDRHIESCSHPALALYLFLVTVADREGLSYYSDPSVMSRLGMDAQTLSSARRNLSGAGLVAYETPLYQVLPLDPGPLTALQIPSGTPANEPVSVGWLCKRLLEEIS